MLGRRNYFDAGAVASRLKQREAKSVPLSAQYSAYQSLLVFRDPITSAVLGHLEMVRGAHCHRHKSRHVYSPNNLIMSLSRATNTMDGSSLDCETLSIVLGLTSRK